MPNIRTAIVIDRPIEHVFDFLSVADNCALWQGSSCSGALGRPLLAGEEVIEEMKWADRNLRIRWTVRSSSRPDSLILEGASEPSGTVVVTYALNPNAQGTRLSRNFRYEIPVLFDSHGGFFGLRNRLHAESAQVLRRLKRVLEEDAVVDVS